jgi:MtN3 and saliva related transmembrane protein
MQQIIGWSASAILLATILSQIVRQWKSGTSEGVSRWLFIGQMAASAGFSVYSWLVGDTVFIFTNLLMLVSAVAGLLIVLKHRRAGR